MIISKLAGILQVKSGQCTSYNKFFCTVQLVFTMTWTHNSSQTNWTQTLQQQNVT